MLFYGREDEVIAHDFDTRLPANLFKAKRPPLAFISEPRQRTRPEQGRYRGLSCESSKGSVM